MTSQRPKKRTESLFEISIQQGLDAGHEHQFEPEAAPTGVEKLK